MGPLRLLGVRLLGFRFESLSLVKYSTGNLGDGSLCMPQSAPELHAVPNTLNMWRYRRQLPTASRTATIGITQERSGFGLFRELDPRTLGIEIFLKRAGETDEERERERRCQEFLGRFVKVKSVSTTGASSSTSAPDVGRSIVSEL